MPNADFFGRLGLYAARGFLDRDLCAGIVGEAATCVAHPAPLYAKEGGAQVAEAFRKTLIALMSEAHDQAVRQRLSALAPLLERHFDLELAGFEPPHVLRYPEGCFFRPHVDRLSDEDAPVHLRRRQVSVSIGLNDQADRAGGPGYCGGSLVFAGLIQDVRAQKFGFPLIGEAGVLIAFPSHMLHEVQAVTYGQRYSIVTWFF